VQDKNRVTQQNAASAEELAAAMAMFRTTHIVSRKASRRMPAIGAGIAESTAVVPLQG
jgi:hypothetical protein